MRYLAAVIVIAAIPAHAELYKCKGTDGKVSYQDTPCATASGERLNIQNQRTDPYRQFESDIQAQQDIRSAQQLDMDRERRQRQADLDRQLKDIDRRAKTDRCAGYKEKAADAEYWSNRFSSGDLKERERAKAEAYRNQHWSECFAGR